MLHTRAWLTRAKGGGSNTPNACGPLQTRNRVVITTPCALVKPACACIAAAQTVTLLRAGTLPHTGTPVTNGCSSEELSLRSRYWKADRSRRG